MVREIVSTDRAPAAIGPYNQAVKAGGFLFTAGQIPLDPASMEIVGTTAAEQARQALINARAVVEAGGASLADVVKVTVPHDNKVTAFDNGPLFDSTTCP